MTTEHPTLSVLSRLDIKDLSKSAPLFAEDFVWHYFNPKLPDLAGDYVGVDGLKRFFDKLGAKTGGTFKVETVSVIPVGAELVFIHAQDSLTLEGQEPITIDVVIVWRIVNGLITEAWDIPSVYSVAQ